MKNNIIILALFVSLSNHSFSQYESIFGQNETTWLIEYHNTYEEHYLDSFYYTNDTLVLGETFKILKCDRTGETWIKEDTTQGKAWIVNPNSTQEFYLIYNLNLQIGDLFQVPQKNTTGIVDSIYYSGGKKHIRLQPYAFTTEKFYIIEGLGLTTSFIFYAGNYLDNLDIITCHFKDGQLNYSWGGACKPPGAYTSINEIQESELKVYPNPTTGKLQLDLPEELEVSAVEVFNMLGQSVFKQKGKPSSLNLDFLEAGNYLLEFQTNVGALHRKVCIE